MPTPPVLTAEQRRRALENSLAVRRHRALVKSLLKVGKISLHDVLSDPQCQGMKVRQVILALPGVADRRAARALQAAGIKEDNTVAQCGDRQIEALLRYVSKI